MRQELCSGIIPVSRVVEKIHLLLVRHRSGDYWGFPKGGVLTPNEELQIAAVRELKEETDLNVLQFLDIPPLHEQYTFFRNTAEISKTVWYYIAETTTIFSLQSKEILDAKWIKLQELFSYSSYASSLALMKQARNLILEFYKGELQ